MTRSDTGSRRTILDGLARILDTGGLEELFSGPDDEALFLYRLLHDVTRGRGSPVYWEICRTGRRRGITPEYVIDRASVLLASVDERRRADIYRILGVPPLASDETIRQRWLEVAKQAHPDAGGDPAAFRQAKEAYEILRDPARRGDYERFWLRAIGPIARLVVDDDGMPAALPAPSISVRSQPERRVVMVAKRTAPASSSGDGAPSESVRMLQQAMARLGEMESRAGLGGLATVHALVERIEHVLAPVSADELAQARAEVDGGIARLEALAAELATLAELKRRLPA